MVQLMASASVGTQMFVNKAQFNCNQTARIAYTANKIRKCKSVDEADFGKRPKDVTRLLLCATLRILNICI